LGRHYPLIVSGNTIREIPPTDTIYESNLVDFSSLTVSGNATVSGDLTVSTNLGVSGDLQVSGNTTGKNAYFHESLNVSGDVEISGTVTAKGAVFEEPVYFSGPFIINNNDNVQLSGGGAGTLSECSGTMPFIYVETLADGTNDTSVRAFGHGSQVGGVSSQDYFGWDDVNKKVDVSAVGIYEILWNAFVTTAAIQEITFRLLVGGVAVYDRTMTIHTITDPHHISILWVGHVRGALGSIQVTRNAASNVLINKSAALFVKRLA